MNALKPRNVSADGTHHASRRVVSPNPLWTGSGEVVAGTTAKRYPTARYPSNMRVVWLMRLCARGMVEDSNHEGTKRIQGQFPSRLRGGLFSEFQEHPCRRDERQQLLRVAVGREVGADRAVSRSVVLAVQHVQQLDKQR